MNNEEVMRRKMAEQAEEEIVEPEEPKEPAETEDSDKDEYLPSICAMRTYGFIKIIGCFIYLASLYGFFAYYNSSRFASIYLKELYWILLMIRPIIITVYCFVMSYMQCHRKISLIKSVRNMDKEEEDK